MGVIDLPSSRSELLKALDMYPDALVITPGMSVDAYKQAQKSLGLSNLKGVLLQYQCCFVETAFEVPSGGTRILLVHVSEDRDFVLIVSASDKDNMMGRLLSVGYHALEFAKKSCKAPNMPVGIHAGMQMAMSAMMAQLHSV